MLVLLNGATHRTSNDELAASERTLAMTYTKKLSVFTHLYRWEGVKTSLW